MLDAWNGAATVKSIFASVSLETFLKTVDFCDRQIFSFSGKLMTARLVVVKLMDELIGK